MASLTPPSVPSECEIVSRRQPRALDEARVHAIEVGGEQRRLVAAGAGADLDDRVAVVERVVREERGLEPRLEVGDGPLEPLDFARGFGGHLGVVNGNELAGFGELVLGLLELWPPARRPAGGVGAPGPARRPVLRVAERVRIGEQPLDLRRPRERVAQQVAEAQRLSSPSLGRLGVWYFWRKRSTRPAVSTSRCLPVKNGWHSAQTSVWISAIVERVSNVLPHAHFTSGRGVLGMDIGLHWRPCLAVSAESETAYKYTRIRS